MNLGDGYMIFCCSQCGKWGAENEQCDHTDRVLTPKHLPLSYGVHWYIRSWNMGQIELGLEVQSWLNEYVITKYSLHLHKLHVSSHQTRVFITFLHDVDMIAFKLRWL